MESPQKTVFVLGEAYEVLLISGKLEPVLQSLCREARRIQKGVVKQPPKRIRVVRPGLFGLLRQEDVKVVERPPIPMSLEERCRRVEKLCEKHHEVVVYLLSVHKRYQHFLRAVSKGAIQAFDARANAIRAHEAKRQEGEESARATKDAALIAFWRDQVPRLLRSVRALGYAAVQTLRAIETCRERIQELVSHQSQLALALQQLRGRCNRILKAQQWNDDVDAQENEDPFSLGRELDRCLEEGLSPFVENLEDLLRADAYLTVVLSDIRESCAVLAQTSRSAQIPPQDLALLTFLISRPLSRGRIHNIFLAFEANPNHPDLFPDDTTSEASVEDALGNIRLLLKTRRSSRSYTRSDSQRSPPPRQKRPERGVPTDEEDTKPSREPAAPAKPVAPTQPAAPIEPAVRAASIKPERPPKVVREKIPLISSVGRESKQPQSEPTLLGRTLAGAELQGANLQGALLSCADLTGANLQKANLQGANLQGAILRGAQLQWANLEGANLAGADLQNAQLPWSCLQDANLSRSDLEKAFLQGAKLEGANLRHAHLPRARLQWAHLQGADLTGAHLEETDFQGAFLQNAIAEQAQCEGANFEGADMTTASFAHAHLVRARLQQANVEEVNFEGADLQGAFFQGASIEGANFEGANLEETSFQGAHYLPAAIAPKGVVPTRWPAEFVPEDAGAIIASQASLAPSTRPGNRATMLTKEDATA